MKKSSQEHHEAFSIFDSLDEVVYVSDPKTYEILYFNQALKKVIPGCKLKGKCFEVLQGLSSPCPFCTNKYLFGKKKTNPYIWEFQNKLDKRWYHCIDRAIKWPDGRMVRCEIAIDFSLRKQAEDTLREQERFLSSIFTGIQDGISVLDKNLNIVRINPVMEKWYAHNAPFVGKKCFEVYHNRKEPCEVCPSQETINTGKAKYEIVPKRGADGKIVGWLDLYSFPFINEKDGKVQGVIEYVRDITDRKLAENKLVISNKRLRQLSLRDAQTGLYNHRYLSEVIETEFTRAQKYSYPFSLIMLDIDYFKSINDVYGHQFGDLVLKQLANQLKRIVRLYDAVIRYGGEEFVIISPSTDRTNALNFAQRILNTIGLYNFGNEKQTVKLKLSLAVTTYPDDKANKGMDMMELVDQILNKAKEAGGNKVYSSVDFNNHNHIVPVEETTNVVFLKEKVNKLTKRANQSLIEAIFAFAKTIEVKDHYTGEHVEKTVHYAIEIAKALNLSEHEVELIEQASMLHDLGKVGISEKILFKKAGLSKKEFTEIKKHPQIGVDIIRPIHFLHPIIPFILHHHEKWNGEGYPYGLKEQDIPLGARIVAIADVYQALISDRPYRKGYSKKQAVNIMKEESGVLFDPALVNVFLEILKSEK